MSNPYPTAPLWADPQQVGSPWPNATPPRTNGMAVTALVVGGVSLLVSLVLLLTLLFGDGAGSLTIRGTAPQVVTGQPYPGPRLAAEVTVVLQDWDYEVSGLRCPATQSVQPGVRTTCTGSVDGSRERVDVSFTDTAGHFTLDQP